MATDTEREYRETADRCRYQRLYRHLRDLDVQEWRTTFDEIERILGFKLPASARVYRQWWENQGNPNHASLSRATARLQRPGRTGPNGKPPCTLHAKEADSGFDASRRGPLR